MGEVSQKFNEHKAHAHVLDKYNLVCDAIQCWRSETYKLAAAIVIGAEGRTLTPDERDRLDDLHAELLLVGYVSGAMRADPLKLGVVTFQ
jgi:hypothetical protein